LIALISEMKAASGLPHSETLSRYPKRLDMPQGFVVRQPYAAVVHREMMQVGSRFTLTPG
jgi:hypothetical protein